MWKKKHHAKMSTKVIVVYIVLALIILSVGIFIGKAKYYYKLKSGGSYGAWSHSELKDGRFGHPDLREGKEVDYTARKGMFIDKMMDGDVMMVEVVAVDADGMTVMSGSDTKTVHIDADTKILKYPEGDFSDLRVGDTVKVIGETGEDGSVNAETIHVNQ